MLLACRHFIDTFLFINFEAVFWTRIRRIAEEVSSPSVGVPCNIEFLGSTKVGIRQYVMLLPAAKLVLMIGGIPKLILI